MALIDKASLLMVPSTYEAGTLYNVLPSGNRAPDETGTNSGYDQTRADFTFDRGSNAAATRVNADGLIEKYRENLLTESNNFSDSDWIKSNTGVTSGQSGYDGSNDAWLLSISGGSSTQRVEQTVNQSGVQTFSAYVKKGTLNWVRIRVNATTIAQSYFDLENGVVGNVQSGLISRSIEDIGSGWYRCSIVFNSTSSTARIYPATGDGNTTQTSGNIYIQNAQLESSMVATDYLDSGATTAKAGVLIDLPRINYDANGENGSLLLEPSRQQLVQYSEYLDGLNKIGTTITANETTSPEGVKNANKITGNGSSGDHQLYTQAISFTSGTSYTISVFAKADTNDFIQFVTHGGTFTNNTWANFNLSSGTTGTIGSDATASIEDYGNGWYRCILTATATSTLSSSVSLFMVTSATSARGESNTLSTSSFLYGLQIEAGSYPTSYIPNHGTSGGVTRAADSIPFNNNIPVTSSAWTVYFELDLEQTELSSNVQKMTLRHSDGTNYQTWRLFTRSNTHHCFVPYFNVDTEYPFSTNVDNNRTDNGKVVMSANGFGTFKLFTRFNGTTTTQTVTGKSNFIARKYQMNTDPHKMGVAKVMFFDEALSDSECQSLVE